MTSIAGHAWLKDAGLQRVLALLNSDGGLAMVVGGAVRNSLMGLPVSDMDIATSLLPEAVIARADAAGIKSIPTGIKHGTVTLVVDGKPFEVTTLRRDVETDGRHAKVEFTGDWKADAERRDLTINALYADHAGNVHDYVGGLHDIDTATIRFIGSAADRIAEDYLRVLRFFRFFAYYGKGRPDADGLKASAAARRQLSSLSAERVWSEVRKLLSAPDPFRALLWMRTAGVLTEVLPETEKWGIDFIPGLISAEAKFGWAPMPMLRLAAIVPPVTDRLDAMAERLKMSGTERKFLQQFSASPEIPAALTDAEFRKLLHQFGTDGVVARLKLAMALAVSKGEDDLVALQRLGLLGRLLELANGWEKPVFPVKGSDLIDKGYEPGPELGSALSKLEDRWIASDFTATREQLVATLTH
jgi:poly(A) polymerase